MNEEMQFEPRLKQVESGIRSLEDLVRNHNHTGYDMTNKLNGVEIERPIFKSAFIGGNKTNIVTPDENIQERIEDLKKAGGGVLFLTNGTHKPTSDITLYSNITLKGENAGSTIIDFQTGAYSIKIIGDDEYTTGTVSVSNNGTTVTGSGTTWSTNVVAGQSILIGGLWYPITVVGGNTSLTIAIPYAGNDLSGASYVIATKKTDVKIIDLTIRNSYGTSAILCQYVDELLMEDVEISGSVRGVKISDSNQITIRAFDIIFCGVGFEFSNCNFTILRDCGAIDSTNAFGTSGDGLILTNCANYVVVSSFMLNSVGNGASITDGSIIAFNSCAFNQNGGKGVEMISGNTDIFLVQTSIQNNTSDGIKLTATSDNTFINSSTIRNNGGYGVNVSASTCDNAVITSSVFDTNTSGAVNDSGTATVVRGNVGVNDNEASSLLGDRLFGNGIDGDVVISTDTTLTSDNQYSNLTINSGINLDTDGYIIYVKGTLTIDGTVRNNGSAGSVGGTGLVSAGGAGGAGGSGGGGNTLDAGTDGGAGGGGGANGFTGSNGVAGDSINPSLGSNGATGGGTGGGAGGTATSENLEATSVLYETITGITANAETEVSEKLTFSGATSGASLSASAGSGGGRGGNSAPTNQGGGGGGGAGGSGGVIAIIANKIILNGNIEVKGGAGGGGGQGYVGVASPGGSGGAGGSGGVICLAYTSLTGVGSLDLSGGTAGSAGLDGFGVSSGSAGSAGNAGKYYRLNVV